MDGKPRLLAQVREQIRPNTTLFVPNASIANGGLASTAQHSPAYADRIGRLEDRYSRPQAFKRSRLGGCVWGIEDSRLIEVFCWASCKHRQRAFL